MDTEFWHQRWRDRQIGFHEGKPNGLLVAHFDALALASGNRVFVPLCGMTRDIDWLVLRGLRVVGVELSTLAIEQLFENLAVTPTITRHGALRRYAAGDVEIYEGDFFALDAVTLGPVDATYDRAALVALPEDMRARYAAHLVAITRAAPQLLISFEYDQAALAGPPFSVPGAEIARHYARHYALSLLASIDVVGGLKGKCPATENAWLLRAP
jgi:thiopurine S-methyltransferase